MAYTLSILSTLAAFFLFSSCGSHSMKLATVTDESLQLFVEGEARLILKVAESPQRAALYKIGLVDFPRKDILGLSIGNRKIFISYELTRRAYGKESYRWILRQTLAHEIAHDVLGGEIGSGPQLTTPGVANRVTAQDLGLRGRGSFRPYSQRAELAADRKGMEYWRKIGWDCRIWVRILEDFIKRGYAGDDDHPTHERHRQAVQICDLYSPRELTDASTSLSRAGFHNEDNSSRRLFHN